MSLISECLVDYIILTQLVRDLVDLVNVILMFLLHISVLSEECMYPVICFNSKMLMVSHHCLSQWVCEVAKDLKDIH
jgi:hypothetical protein